MARLLMCCVLAAMPGGVALHADEPARPAGSDSPLRMVVMDPLAEPLSCACVKGHGQRKYDLLAAYLKQQLGRPVEIIFDESLQLAYSRAGREIDLIVGKDSVVRFDATRTETQLKPLVRLTDHQGRTMLRGVFLVRKEDPARSLEDLAGRLVMLGPVENAETHRAARAVLEAKKKPAAGSRLKTAGSIESAVYAVADGEADAAVVSDFLPPLLEGCGKVERGALRVIGQTEEVPFVCVFATSRVGGDLQQAVRQALLKAGQRRDLLAALESKRGFVGLDEHLRPGDSETAEAAGIDSDSRPRSAGESPSNILWTDWRGPLRDGRSPYVPQQLPAEPKVLWKAEVTGPALAGMAATDEFLVVPDKDAEQTTDIFRCLDPKTGSPKWTLSYPAEKRIDYTNAPRATPVIHQGLVYLQGAVGDLHCVELTTGRVIWKTNLVAEFDAPLLTWGCSIPPLVVDDRLIVAPGGKEASLVALDLKTGRTIWKTPGHAAAYAAFMVGRFGGVRQIVGYDVAGLAGWDPQSGRRLWEMIPRGQADFHVATPVVVPGGLLLATENNATRRYTFNEDGRLRPQPVATNQDLAPDTCTPVVVGDRVFATAYGELHCLNLKDGLKTIWRVQDDRYFDHTNLIASDSRLLIWTTTADLLLIRADVDRYEIVSELRPFADDDAETMSHPAILADRLFLRHQRELVCWSL